MGMGWLVRGCGELMGREQLAWNGSGDQNDRSTSFMTGSPPQLLDL